MNGKHTIQLSVGVVILAIYFLGSGLIFSAGCRRSSPVTLAASPPALDIAAVNGARALALVSEFTALGAREAGTPGGQRGAEWIADHLRTAGVDVVSDVFSSMTPKGPRLFQNVIGKIPGDKSRRLVLAAHYDTKAGIPGFVGANDSGSGVAVLLELAPILWKARGVGPEIILAFLDGEECIVSYGPHDGLQGSRRLAEKLNSERWEHPVIGVVVLDMVGDRDLTLMIPRNSTPAMMAAVFAAAERQSIRSLVRLADGDVIDDHVPFLDKGFPAVDVIDFEYGSAPGLNDYWHTAADTPDKLSAASLETVGRLALGIIADQRAACR